MKKKTLLAAVVAMLLITAPAAHAADTNAPLLAKADATGSIRLIVQLKIDTYTPESKLASTQAVSAQRQAIAQAQQQLLAKLATSYQLTAVKGFATIPYMALQINAAGLRALLADPAVVSIQEDIPVPPVLNESVPFINADQVHTDGLDGSGWTVAILDTGVRTTHEFLDTGKIVSEACYSTTYSSLNSTSLCPGGAASSTALGSGVNCDPAISSCSHGTHVAGIAAGTDGTTVAKGVAPGATVIAIQVFSRFDNKDYCGSDNPCVLSFPSDQISALERVYALRSTYNIAAANMSLGGGKYNGYCDTDAIKAVIDNLRAAGIATVIASGNDGWDGYISAPGCVFSAVTVGATLDTADTLASYSNHASMVDLLAPGSGITSATAASNASYSTWGGTSMATPHVTGAFAVMKQKNSAWTVDEIESLLEATGVSVTRASISKPRIDLLSAAAGLPPVLSSPHPADGTTVSSYNAASRELRVAEQYAESCTIYYGTTSSPSFSVVGTLNEGFCSATVPYGADLTNDGINYWYVEAMNFKATVRYPASGTMSFTARNVPVKAMPWLNIVL